jgi:hypothetical protein
VQRPFSRSSTQTRPPAERWSEELKGGERERQAGRRAVGRMGRREGRTAGRQDDSRQADAQQGSHDQREDAQLKHDP